MDQYKVGQKARVLKGLTIDIYYVKEYLGAVCTVESSDHRYVYLRLGKRVEPFDRDELDRRFLLTSKTA